MTHSDRAKGVDDTGVNAATAGETTGPTAGALTIRQVMAVAALLNAGVALYLHLWKLGFMGALACGAGHGCEMVQLSSWGWFLGVDVALIGAVGYTLILVVAILGTQERFASDRWPSLVLMALVYPAFVFTLRLKYAEFIIMKTFCPWCAISAVTMTAFTVLVWLDWKRVREAAAS
ncbi:MAG: vitamin K epoxide reductase family protein [Gemmatimonadaceae bacterium]|nr:vitamin K epoxide reductase family protein [Gemmatimonadaceae bacterium]